MSNNFSTEIEEISTVDTKTGAKVILFNDDIHSFDEVINQLIKAIDCSKQLAKKYAFEVHTKGKACVFDGEMTRAIIVSHILEEIGLLTQIEI